MCLIRPCKTLPCDDDVCLTRPCDAPRAKYALAHTVRSHMGAQDGAYQCMGVAEDAQATPLTLRSFGTLSRTLSR